MSNFNIKKGLNLPVKGTPNFKISDVKNISKVAIVADDFPGLKPLFLIKEGDKVSIGDKLFVDKKNENVFFTSPAQGVVKSVNRAEKRRFVSLEIEVTGDKQKEFTIIDNFDTDDIQSILIDTGLWTLIKSRPFGKVANPEIKPDAIFVSLLDTRPLAPEPEFILKGKEDFFNAGLEILSKFTDKLFVSVKPDSNFKFKENIQGLQINTFEGKHPAGLTGTQIYYLYPVNLNRIVWEIDYQNVAAIGYFFKTGKIQTEKIVALTGPSVRNPEYIRTVNCANIEEAVKGRLIEGNNRIISGSILYGYKAENTTSYLSQFSNQISVIPENNERKFMGWAAPGFKKFSVKNVFASKLNNDKNVIIDTNLNGSKRPIVPIGSYEKVTPFDFEMTYLLRALASEDWEKAEMLGAVELLEEDLSLCTFVCPGKNDYGPMLRKFLDWLEKEG